MRRCINYSLLSFIVFGVSISSGYSQQMPKMNTDSAKVKSVDGKESIMSDDEEIAHPFFTHMGMPEAVGTYSLRLAALATRMDGKTKGDFAFHFETGLSKFVGLHIRNDRFLDNTHLTPLSRSCLYFFRKVMYWFTTLINF